MNKKPEQNVAIPANSIDRKRNSTLRYAMTKPEDKFSMKTTKLRSINQHVKNIKDNRPNRLPTCKLSISSTIYGSTNYDPGS